MTQLILKDTTGPIVAYLPRSPGQPLGKPSAASIGVRTPADDSLASPQPATIDPVASVTNQDAARGTHELRFAAAPGATRFRLYILDHPSLSQPFYVQVADVAGTSVFLTDPLPCDIPAGAQFLGAALTLALSVAQTATVDTITTSIAQVEATVSGVTRRWDHEIRIVRQEFAQALTVPKLLKLAPEVMRWRSDGSTTYGELIDAGYEYLIQDLEGRGYEVTRINSPSKLNLALVKRIRWALLDSIHGPAHEDTKEAEGQYRDQIRMAEAGSRFWYDDADQNLATGRQNPSPFSTAWRAR